MHNMDRKKNISLHISYPLLVIYIKVESSKRPKSRYLYTIIIKHEPRSYIIRNVS